MVLACNKYDLIENKEESLLQDHQEQEYLDEFAKLHGFGHALMISAKTGHNVTNAFSTLVYSIIVRRGES